MTLSFAPLTPADAQLLAEATLGNVNWCGPRFSASDVRDIPEFAHYTHLVPDRGDFGVVALDAEDAVGVVWALFLPADDAGYGFVDDTTPEVSLWVAAHHRNRGIGRALLDTLIAEAGNRHISRLSLSVESGNHAEALYRAAGFRPSPGGETNGIMVMDLVREHPPEH